MKVTNLTTKKFSSFLQTSDIHIGESRKIPNYLERHKDVLWQIMDKAEKNGLPILIPGDLFHRADTTHDERKLAYDFLAECEKRKIYTVVTAGNHDHLFGKMTQLDALYNIPFKYIKIITWDPEIVILGNIGIIGLSWQDYTAEQTHDVVRNAYPLIAECEHKIVMMHEFIYGSTMDNGKIMYRGLKLPADIPEINYWCIGDIHTFQPGNLPNSWYSGSPLQFKHDDSVEKGYIKVKLPFTERPEFIKTHFKPFLTVSKMEDMKEDAYYNLVGTMDEVVNANKDNRVIRTNWDIDVTEAISDINSLSFSVVTGLTEFLANKGINQQWQEYALGFVQSKVVKL